MEINNPLAFGEGEDLVWQLLIHPVSYPFRMGCPHGCDGHLWELPRGAGTPASPSCLQTGWLGACRTENDAALGIPFGIVILPAL